MNSTDLKVQQLQQRIARNQRLYVVGAVDDEREDLKRKLAGPLVGMAFLAGMAFGSTPGIIYVLREPLMRNALQILHSLLEEP